MELEPIFEDGLLTAAYRSVTHLLRRTRRGRAAAPQVRRDQSPIQTVRVRINPETGPLEILLEINPAPRTTTADDEDGAEPAA